MVGWKFCRVASALLVCLAVAWLGDEPSGSHLSCAQSPELLPQIALQPRLVLPVHIVRVIDGDTVEVKPNIVLTVRLLDCWVADDTDKDKQAAEYLKTFVNKRLLLDVPLGGDNRIRRAFSFGRVLGRLYAGRQQLNAEIVRQGWGTRTKPIETGEQKP